MTEEGGRRMVGGVVERIVFVSRPAAATRGSDEPERVGARQGERDGRDWHSLESATKLGCWREPTTANRGVGLWPSVDDAVNDRRR